VISTDKQGPLLTRMSTFALASVKSVGEVEEMLPVPTSIRGLALLSQLAVYKDIIPGKYHRLAQRTLLMI
jgi:nucleolar complex protein 3